jgi:hypothetical protein
MRNISDKSCRENQNSHFDFSNFPPPHPENLAVYGKMSKNIVRTGQATDDMAHAHCMLDA